MSGLPPVFISAIPWNEDRAANAALLARQAGGTIVWDRRRDHYDTFLRMIAAAGSGPAIFLEDDIQLTSGWGDKIGRVIADHGDVLIQCYSNRRADVEHGSRLEPGSSYLNNQCWYAPAGMPAELHAYLTSWPGRAKDPTGTDLAVSHFLRDRGLSYWIQVPSLVQHNTWKSAINPRRPTAQRQSRTYQP